jgi:uncharacterized surface protein with fasciclin (FAS1) repeats
VNKLLPLVLLVPGVLAVPATSQAPARDVLELAQRAGTFSTLLAAVDAAGLAETLRGPGPFTVLAPSDAAFAALPEGAVAALLAEPERLAAVLKAHVLAGRQTAADLVGAGSALALDGSRWPVRIEAGRLQIGGAALSGTDLGAGNGLVQVLDGVLLPAAAAEPTAASSAVYTAALARALRDERETAARILAAAIEAGAGPEALIGAAVDAAAALPGHPATRSALDALARAAREDGEISSLERGLDRALDDLRFRPYVEAELPLGWPDAAPVGEVVLKAYPRYRMAKTGMSGRGGTSTPFFALFNHIKRNEIAMTAPVQMDFDEDGRRRSGSMAFLYAHPNQGDAGADARDERVEVVDVAPLLAVSIGGRGYEMADKTDALQARLEAWLQAHAAEFERAGPLRTMGYNSPMVPSARRFFEVEMPVRRIRSDGE